MFSASMRSFAAGEISPALYARSDLVKYQTGLKACRNFVVMKAGGVENRAGWRFMAEAKFHDRKSRGFAFVYSIDQTYRLEFGHLYMRVMRNGAVLGAPYEITTPYTEADLVDLKFDQSADVVTITHPSYAPRELRRLGHTSWTLTTPTWAPAVSAPEDLLVTPGGAGSDFYSYVVTFVHNETFEESLGSAPYDISSAAGPTGSAPHVVTWTAVAGFFTRIYRIKNGKYGYIGTADGDTFNDTGYDPDTTQSPPVARDPFAGGAYPQCSTYYQQRHVFGGALSAPERVHATRVGAYHNFCRSDPGQDDDAVTFNLTGRRVNEVRHLLDLGTLVVLTSSTEVTVLGNADGALLPDAVNAKVRGYSGASKVAPAVVQDSAVYVQSRGQVLRDLKYHPEADGYVGRDLTVFSGHLFEGRTIVQLAYAEVPNSIVWVLLDNGTLLGLTYLREHEVWGWHRHDTDGVIEDICVVPEGAVDMLYAVVNRTVNGFTKRYIERMDPRFIADPMLAFFVDSGLTYDGRNVGATTMRLTGAGWTIADDLTLTANAATFVAGDVGNEVVLRGGALELRCRIKAFVSSTVVTVRTNRTVETAYRGVATTRWGMAKDEFTLDHLAGKSVIGLADGEVVGPFTVTGGKVTLATPAEVVSLGLPYTSEIETLPVDNPQGESLRDKQQRVRSVTLLLRQSRGGWVGDDRGAMHEIEQRQAEHYDDPVSLSNRESVLVDSSWRKDAGVVVQQRDPLPMTILGAIPHMQTGGA